MYAFYLFYVILVTDHIVECCRTICQDMQFLATIHCPYNESIVCPTACKTFTAGFRAKSQAGDNAFVTTKQAQQLRF
jgi:hypothetical protein